MKSKLEKRRIIADSDNMAALFKRCVTPEMMRDMQARRIRWQANHPGEELTHDTDLSDA